MRETPESKSPPNSTDLKGIAIIAAPLVVLFLVLLPQFQAVRDYHPPPKCSNVIEQMALALHEYHDTYGSFPPAYIADENGRPMHSWRVLILPFLDEADLHAAYDFNEPWDGPNNRKLHDRIVETYRCPEQDAGAPATDTDYVAVVGPQTMWPGGRPLTIGGVTDGASSTLFVVEVRNSGIHWMEPRDLEFDKMSFVINDPAGNSISSNHVQAGWGFDRRGVNVAMANGAWKWLDADTAPELVKSLLTATGGEPLPEGWDSR